MEENNNQSLSVLTLITGAGFLGLMVVACVLGLFLILVLSVSLSGGEAQAETAAIINGQVIYRERIALPEDAVVTVQLRDVSLADAESILIGEQVIEQPGQVPIAYAVAYSEDDIVDNHTYSVSARITDHNGELLFISDTAILVITQGNPTEDVEIIVVQAGG